MRKRAYKKALRARLTEWVKEAYCWATHDFELNYKKKVRRYCVIWHERRDFGRKKAQENIN